jgi:hypothetical protein
MKKNLRAEEGVALVTGLLVSMVVLILSVSAVSLSIHNTGASSYDRRRLQSIDAAEAGIDAYFSMLGTTRFSQVPNHIFGTGTTNASCVLTGSLSGTPTATYTVTPTFYSNSTGDESSGATACPERFNRALSTGLTRYVVLRSVGVVAGQAAPARTMMSKARLSVTTTSANFPSAAIYAHGNASLSANIDLYSASGRNDANIYSDQSLTVTTRTSIRGSLYVQGSVTIANGNFWARGDVWANNALTVSGGRIDGTAISSTSTIGISGNTSVFNAKAAGAITVQSPPARVYGTVSPNTAGIGPPPSYSYPTYTWNAADWPDYITATSCLAAQSAITGWDPVVHPNLYIRLTGCSDLSVPQKSNVPGNLGIISDGSITLPVGTNLATTSTTPYRVYFIAGVTGTCGNFLANSNSGVGANLKTLIYTPGSCSATMESNSSFASGQIFAGTVTMRSNAPFTFESVSLPGTTDEPVGSLVDIVYKREI